jgi:ubiquinone/menaquinone biosynthesis C-methylase UbiE
MSSDSTTPRVRAQYESYPYPPRDPSDEKRRLISLAINELPRVNFYCFAGKQDFRNIRVLDAGGGTGDSTIQWAEQLRDRGGEVVYLDISRASQAIARERAKARGLDNILWLQESIETLPRLDIGQFDFIVCTGVLHHLDDPAAGLAALVDKLKADGSMGLMLYGKYGRAPVYQMQELMRLINDAEPDLADKIDNTKRVLQNLPESNAFKRGEALFSDHRKLGDAGICDLFLHARDRAFSITEVHALIEAVGLHFVEFCNPAQRICYAPAMYIKDAELLAKIRALDLRVQQQIAEILVGALKTHGFYVAKRPGTVARLDDLDNVPFFFPNRTAYTGAELAQTILTGSGEPIKLRHPTGIEFDLPADPTLGAIFKYLDGKRSLREIFACVREPGGAAALTDAELFAHFAPAWRYFNALDWLLLKTKVVPHFNESI